jgi:hypothetical protein
MELDIDVLVRLGDGIVVFAGGRVIPTCRILRRVLAICMRMNGCTPYVGGGLSPAL